MSSMTFSGILATDETEILSESDKHRYLADREWLETNRLGGYASSTLAQSNARKYHGLLVVPCAEPAGKFVLLSAIDDALTTPDKTVYPLSGFDYRDAASPGASVFCEAYDQSSHPLWRYQFPFGAFEKAICLLPDSHTVILRYTNLSELPLEITLKPLMVCRDFHALTHENPAIATRYTTDAIGVMCYQAYSALPPLYIACSGVAKTTAEPMQFWYHAHHYPFEIARGFDGEEDSYCPFAIHAVLPPGESLFVSCGTRAPEHSPALAYDEEVMRRSEAMLPAMGDAISSLLERSRAQFLTQDDGTDRASIIAGFPWFLAWGRDAMIALPGLCLTPPQMETETARAILCQFAAARQDGIIPNFLSPDPACNAYNSVDASLWFIHAAELYYQATQDKATMQTDVFPAMLDIVQHYRRGTRHHIHMQSNGLLWAGSPTENLTWMDAQVDGMPVTPRYGLAVEINALWYHALCIVHNWAKRFAHPYALELPRLLHYLPENFQKTFWDPARGMFADVVNENGSDFRIRPNQIFAASLPNRLITADMAQKMVTQVTEHLLTPYGLRTLSPEEPDYQGTYSGGSAERDRAYHNGTIWPWLLGHYVDASVFAFGIDATREKLAICCSEMRSHLMAAGVGSISEVFSGDFPHHPGGCIAQAWSVAEWIRLSHILGVTKCDGWRE